MNAGLESHPTGVRGLKFWDGYCLWPTVVSHPTGVRGLKYLVGAVNRGTKAVAPHWGAWIEIIQLAQTDTFS